jgi:hypothetical protein
LYYEGRITNLAHEMANKEIDLLNLNFMPTITPNTEELVK